MPHIPTVDGFQPQETLTQSSPSGRRAGNFRGFVTQIPSGLWAISRIPAEQRRSKIFWLYLKLIANLYASSHMAYDGTFEEDILGARMRVLDYRAFVDSFAEIFVRRDYYFKADSPTPLILDCGSNIGISVLFFKQLYPTCRIISFEPDRLTFEVLQQNIQRNRFEGVELRNQAIYPKDGFVEFYSDPVQPGSLAMSTARERFPGREVNSRKVEAVRLSHFIQEEVDLLKMDIEGAEDSVIDELAGTGKLSWIKEIFVGYHHHLNPAEDQLSRLLRTFEENGFGYQMHGPFTRPFERRAFQDVQIYAYRRP